MEKFVCSHCGNRFESEPAETLICPHCFWSTSVKKVEGIERETSGTSPSRSLFWAGAGFFVLILALASLFVSRHLRKQNEILKKIETKNSQVIASQAPELGLSPGEKEILSRRISLSPVHPLSELEKEILARRILLGTRLARGIQTPPWDENQFEAFLKEEETYYKIPLERSYRRKLKQVFRLHYLAAARAFEEKDYLKARNEWILSLAFPIYQNNVDRHRGVVLTMLRPHINDTLSKIGMMNVLLTEKEQYGAEEKIRADYDSLHGLLQNQLWEEASAKILELENQLRGIEKAPVNVTPPPLPDAVSQIDPDIREVLLAQVSPLPASSRDWESLQQDLAIKAKIIQGQIPSALQATFKQYDEALALIGEQNWTGARRLLKKIDFPEELAEDAKAKIRVLDKWIQPDTATLSGPSLDSKGDSG